MHCCGTSAAILTASLLLAASSAETVEVRIKDLADIQGARANPLVGYGIVVGLNGTGDKSLPVTRAALSNMLEHFNIRVPASALKTKNVASVIVTAELPPFARAGARIDVLVASAGDSKSLQGGVLLMTPLRAANGDVYAMAQGALSVGGFAASSGGGGGGGSVQKNHPSVGRVPSGATVEREIDMPMQNSERLVLVVRRPDFTTAKRLADAVSDRFADSARAIDASTVEVTVPPESRKEGIVAFVSEIEALTLTPDNAARVVICERTGTVVAGEGVRLSPAAVAHGNLYIRTQKTPVVSQPAPFSRGETVVASETQTSAEEEEGRVAAMKGSTTVGELADVLNSLGVKPRDIIAVFQLLKAAGALHGELVVM